MGQTDVGQGTAFALGAELRLRRLAGRDEGVEALGGVFRLAAQGLVELHLQAPPGGAVEERPARDRDPVHFFQTERLRAKLYEVWVVSLWAPAFVLHGERLPEAVEVRQANADRGWVFGDR